MGLVTCGQLPCDGVCLSLHCTFLLPLGKDKLLNRHALCDQQEEISMLQLQTPGNVPIMCKSLRLLRKGEGGGEAGFKSFRKLHKKHSKLNGILQSVTFDRFIYLFNSKTLMKVALEQQILSCIRISGPQHSRFVPLTFEVYMQAPAGTG